MSRPVFKSKFRVVWADTDAAGVVHYSNYFRFFERAEEEFYRSLNFSFTDIAKKGLWFPRVEAFCQYKKPAKFDDLLQVELAVGELKQKSMKISFRILNSETSVLLATGHVIIVVADKHTGKSTQMPADIAEKLRPFAKQINQTT
jgi:acyl-CoA thioester hydrolase